MKFPETQSFTKSEATSRLINIYLCQMRGVRNLGWWVIRTIKIAILSVAFNREQLETFLILFEACFLFPKPMKFSNLLKIYLFFVVILYKYYEADTETDKVAPHFSSCYGSFCTFYLYGVLLQCLANSLFW